MRIIHLMGQGRNRAFLLVESLVYGSILMIVLGVGIVVFNNYQLRSLRLQRNTREIAQVLQLGEQWRNEIRTGVSVEWVQQGEPPHLRLESTNGVIDYAFEMGAVLKRLNGGNWSRLLGGVVASEMKPEQRAHALIWTWEIELTTFEKSPRLKPVFTFLAAKPPLAP